MFTEGAALADLVHVDIGWRERLTTLLVGPRPSLRRAAVDAACATLGIR
ncbi:MAG: hypothetical protein J2P24_11840 [Streptosporangiales bacterium]|nr:hypothetical protein [Streptosporangiales bacterium]MBO0889479.1 hypothetical protein [Acidothermales bacterium]